jgi:hypothetical protein
MDVKHMGKVYLAYTLPPTRTSKNLKGRLRESCIFITREAIIITLNLDYSRRDGSYPVVVSLPFRGLIVYCNAHLCRLYYVVV